MGNLAQPLGVHERLNLVKQSQVIKIVDQQLLLKNHHNAITPDPDPLDLGPERQLPHAPRLEVVPDHDFIPRVLRNGAAADEGHDIGPEQHSDDSDTSSAGSGGGGGVEKVAAEDFPEGIGAVGTESVGGSGGEAGGVLVEGDVKQIGGGGDRVSGERRDGARGVGFGVSVLVRG